MLLNHLLERRPEGARGKDISVETTLGAMLAHLNGDALLRAGVQDMSRLMDRALLWMHEQQVVILGRGLDHLQARHDGSSQPEGWQLHRPALPAARKNTTRTRRCRRMSWPLTRKRRLPPWRRRSVCRRITSSSTATHS